MKEKRVCIRCGTEVSKSQVEGYSYECVNCYEDLYEFETTIVKYNDDNTLPRPLRRSGKICQEHRRYNTLNLFSEVAIVGAKF